MAVPDHFRVEVRHASDRVVLALRGELDLASAPALQAEIEEAAGGGAPRIVLDLTDLEFIDSTGLRIMLAAHENARERGQELVLTQASEQVQRLLRITGVGEHLRIIDPSDEIAV